MKQITKLVLIITTVFLFLAGCKENKKDLIVKKWEITDVKANGENVPEDRMQVMRKLVMEFTNDSNLIVSGLPDGTQTSGKYSLSEDGKVLTTTKPGGPGTANEVITLTKTALVFKDPKGGFTFYMKSK